MTLREFPKEKTGWKLFLPQQRLWGHVQDIKVYAQEGKRYLMYRFVELPDRKN